jgi:hypothetical protein
MKPLRAALILLILFAAMTAVSWQRWANPVIDGGREMSTPLRLLNGEQIYSGVYYLYGPVAPFFNAFLYRVFGATLDTLYIAGITCGLLLVFLIFHLGRRFMSTFEAMLAAAAVLLLCVFKQRGNMIFPYSYAALYGTVLGVLALAAQLNYVRSAARRSLWIAGLLSGLTLCCKLEFGFAAVASLAVVATSSRRGERLRTAGIVLLSTLTFPVLIYGFLLTHIPAGAIVKDTFLLPGHIPPELMYFNRLKLGMNNPGRTFRELMSAVALLCGAGGLTALAGIRMAGESIFSAPLAQSARRIWWILGICDGFLILHVLIFGTHWDLNPFRALPLLFLWMVGYLLIKLSKEGSDASNRELLLLSVYSLAVLARVFIRIPAGGSYGAGLVPVPLLLFVYMATADLPIFPISAAAARCRRRMILVSLSIAFAAVAVVLTWRQVNTPHRPLHSARGELRLPATHISAMAQALEFIARESRPGEYLAAFPEGSSLNFLSNRPVPFRYEITTPGFLSREEEQRMIRQMDEKQVRFIFFLNRPTTEFGPSIFGVDYCRTIGEWIDSNYEVAAVFGDGLPLDVQIGDPAFFIKCYQRKESRQ